jgi:hypothetical protein
MPLSAGIRFAPHEIVAALGAGGTGEVYRARGSHLGRENRGQGSASQAPV